MTIAAMNGDPVFHWFPPVRGDSRDPGVVTPADGVGDETRAPSLDYPTLVAQAAEQAGLQSLLTPVGIGCLDPWVVCSAVAARTRRIGFILAFRPTLASPTLPLDSARRREHRGLVLIASTAVAVAVVILSGCRNDAPPPAPSSTSGVPSTSSHPGSSTSQTTTPSIPTSGPLVTHTVHGGPPGNSFPENTT